MLDPVPPQTRTSPCRGFESLSAHEAAVLALWPANADRVIALTALAQAAPDRPRDLPAAARCRRWLAFPESEATRATVTDGVFDEPPLVQSAIRGNRYALVTGFLNDPDLHVRLWTDALSEAQDDPASATALDLLLTACAVSDVVVEASGIADGGRWPDHGLGGTIGVPDDETFDRIADALLITPEQFGEPAARPKLLEPLIRRVGQSPGSMWRHPLIRRDDGTLLVASPADLLRAAIVAAADQVAESPASPRVAASLRAGAIETLRIIAGDLDSTVEHATDTGVLIRFDDDKLLAVELVVPGPQPSPDVAAVVDLVPHLHEPLERLARARAQDPEVVLGIVAFVGDGRLSEWSLPDPSGPFGPWPASLADLRLIGDALRRDQLALWRQLEHAPPPPWPGGAQFTDVVGLARRQEEHPVAGHDDDHLSADGTEYLHQRARLMAGRHPAPAPPGGRMVTVTRWGGSPDARIFAPETSCHDGTLLARGSGRFAWISPAEKRSAPGTLQEQLVSMTAFWAARLLHHGWLWFPQADEVGIDVVVDFHDAPGAALAVTPAAGGLRLIAGPAFVHALSRGDNTADRLLVHALALWWLRMPQPAARLVDVVAPLGHATFTVWPQPDLRVRSLGPEPPPLVPDAVRRRVEAEVAAHVVEPDQLAVVDGQDVLLRLDDLIRVLLATIERRVADMRPEVVLEAVRIHERALAQEERENIALPARVGMPDADQTLGRREAHAVRGVSLRGLVEHLAARPPQGAAMATLEHMTELRARFETLVDWGTKRDAVRAGLADARLLVAPRIGIGVDVQGRGPRAVTAMTAQHEEAAPRRMLAEHDTFWTGDPQPEPELHLDEPIDLADEDWQAIDDAMLGAWGYRWEELVRILRALSNRSLHEPDGTAAALPGELAVLIADDTAIAPDRVGRVLADLRLGPDESYDALDTAHKPWGVNRERSYIRRPLVGLPDGRVAWSAEHVLRTARHLHSLCLQNRLRAPASLRRAVGRASQSNDAAFEAEVARRVRAAGWKTLERRKRLGGARLERVRGQDLGDLDVVAFCPADGVVLLLEAKRLFPALRPIDFEAEATELARHAARHRERMEWVRAHPERLEREIGLPAPGCGWSVSGALVVDVPLAGAHLVDVGLPVWTIDELHTHLS